MYRLRESFFRAGRHRWRPPPSAGQVSHRPLTRKYLISEFQHSAYASVSRCGRVMSGRRYRRKRNENLVCIHSALRTTIRFLRVYPKSPRSSKVTGMQLSRVHYFKSLVQLTTRRWQPAATSTSWGCSSIRKYPTRHTAPTSTRISHSKCAASSIDSPHTASRSKRSNSCEPKHPEKRSS